MRRTILITLACFISSLVSADSLWRSKRNDERSMFADRVANSIGDILTIAVNEANSVTRSSSKTSASTSSVDYGIDSYLFPGSSFGTHNGEKPSIDFAPQDSFSGEGSFSDANTITARAAVLVVDVLPNGNLVVEGARKIEMSGETQYIVLRGIVRADDINPDNSVMSYDVVNANIEFFSEGDIHNAQKKGWINRLLDTVNVF